MHQQLPIIQWMARSLAAFRCALKPHQNPLLAPVEAPYRSRESCLGPTPPSPATCRRRCHRPRRHPPRLSEEGQGRGGPRHHRCEAGGLPAAGQVGPPSQAGPPSAPAPASWHCACNSPAAASAPAGQRTQHALPTLGNKVPVCVPGYGQDRALRQNQQASCLAASHLCRAASEGSPPLLSKPHFPVTYL